MTVEPSTFDTASPLAMPIARPPPAMPAACCETICHLQTGRNRLLWDHYLTPRGIDRYCTRETCSDDRNDRVEIRPLENASRNSGNASARAPQPTETKISHNGPVLCDSPLKMYFEPHLVVSLIIIKINRFIVQSSRQGVVFTSEMLRKDNTADGRRLQKMNGVTSPRIGCRTHMGAAQQR